MFTGFKMISGKQWFFQCFIRNPWFFQCLALLSESAMRTGYCGWRPFASAARSRWNCNGSCSCGRWRRHRTGGPILASKSGGFYCQTWGSIDDPSMNFHGGFLSRNVGMEIFSRDVNIKESGSNSTAVFESMFHLGLFLPQDGRIGWSSFSRDWWKSVILRCWHCSMSRSWSAGSRRFGGPWYLNLACGCKMLQITYICLIQVYLIILSIVIYSYTTTTQECEHSPINHI